MALSAGDNSMESKLENVGLALARQLSFVGESVDSASLFAAFEEGSGERGPTPAEPKPLTVVDSSPGETPRVTGAVGVEPVVAAGKGEDRVAKQQVWRDKVCFVLGIFNLASSSMWIGASPHSFYIAYTFKAALLFLLRLYYYRKQKLHYYFFDFCYLVNALLLLHCWVPYLRGIKSLWVVRAHFVQTLLLTIPYEYHAWTSCQSFELTCSIVVALFACASGPLVWSIPALRNSLVLHDFDKTTSLFMHWSPVVVVWTLRWYPTEGHPMNEPITSQVSVMEIVLPATLLYTSWCVAYYLKVFVISERKIRERGYDTLYSYMLRNGSVGKTIDKYPPALRPLIYLAGHAAACTTTFLVSVLFFHSFYVHTALLFAISLAATWNGACYYFDYFSFRYVPSLGLAHKLQPSKEE